MPVDSKHKDYTKMIDKWTRCRDAACGQDAVHAKGELYLPKLIDQPQDAYSSYVKRAPFYNATWRTLSGLVGMLFRQPPRVEASEQLKTMFDDITMSGTPLQLFAQEVCEETLKLGRLGLLVDFPQADATSTLADAKTQNLRPTMQLYYAEAVINWRTGKVRNTVVLTQVVLEEEADIMVDEYASKSEKRWRVLDLIDVDTSPKYRVRIFRKGADEKEEQVGNDLLPLMNSKPLDYIPFTFVSTDDVTTEVDDPPLIDLVDTNLSHYRTSADLEHGAHFTGLPTAVVSGYKPKKEGEKLYIGSSSAWVFPDANAKATYLEFTGQGLTTLVNLKDSKEKQMAVLGARMLEQQKKAAETIDTTMQHRKGEESMLSAAAQAISLAMEKALRWFAEWAGQDPESVEFELNRDFYPAPMTPLMLQALVAGWQAGAYSDQVLFENLQQGEVISRETTLEEEQQRLADKPPQLLGGQVDPKTGLPVAPPPLPKTPPAPPATRQSTIKTPNGDTYTVTHS